MADASARPRHNGPIAGPLADEWTEVLHLGVRRTYPRGAFIMMPQSPVEHLYLLTSGEVHISNFSAAESPVPVMFARPGAIMGLIPFFTSGVSESFWQVQSDCVVHLFSRAAVHNDLPRGLLLNLLERIAGIGRHLTTRSCTQRMRNKEKQLASLLLHLCHTCAQERGPDETGIRVHPGIPQYALGRLLGMHRVHLNRLLGLFRREGIIGRFTKNLLEIHNQQRLEALADGRESFSPEARDDD